jgi:hypothetical protein
MLAVVAGMGAVVAAPCTQIRANNFQISFVAGSRDAAGRFAGGTEMRLLTAHAGRLYAGNGYWEDRPGPEGLQAAQILVLDRPGMPWRVDHAFEERLPNGRWRDLAVGALAEADFGTDGSGVPLPRPVSLLLASTWDLTGAARVFTRDDATGPWSAVTLAEDRPSRDFLPQIRSSRRIATGSLESTWRSPARCRAASSRVVTIRWRRAGSDGALRRNSTHQGSQPRFPVSPAGCGSVALPRPMVAFMPRSASRSMSGSTGGRHDGGLSIRTLGLAIPRPGLGV